MHSASSLSQDCRSAEHYVGLLSRAFYITSFFTTKARKSLGNADVYFSFATLSKQQSLIYL